MYCVFLYLLHFFSRKIFSPDLYGGTGFFRNTLGKEIAQDSIKRDKTVEYTYTTIRINIK